LKNKILWLQLTTNKNTLSCVTNWFPIYANIRISTRENMVILSPVIAPEETAISLDCTSNFTLKTKLPCPVLELTDGYCINKSKSRKNWSLNLSHCAGSNGLSWQSIIVIVLQPESRFFLTDSTQPQCNVPYYKLASLWLIYRFKQELHFHRFRTFSHAGSIFSRNMCVRSA